MNTAFDTNRDCRRFATFMRTQGFGTAIRYYTAALNPKRLTRAEAQSLVATGFSLAAVFQERARGADDFSEALGQEAGRQAHDYASGTIGQPTGSAIYFSVDFDASAAELTRQIQPYFTAVRAALDEAGAGQAPYRVGVYGSGLTCRVLREAGLVDFTWLSMSMGFRESRKFRDGGTWNLLQSLTVDVMTPAGRFSYDPNEVGAAGCGDFLLEAAPLATGTAMRARVTARAGLFLRAGPGTEFAKLGLLAPNTELSILRTTGDWALVDLEGDGLANGHCHSAFLAPI